MHDTACSPYFMTHILGPAETTPALLRQTRLADLAHALDPRLVAAAFGMTSGIERDVADLVACRRRSES